MTDNKGKAQEKGTWWWECDNCGARNPDNGSGSYSTGYTCRRCDSVMYPTDPGTEMNWRRKE